MIYVIKLVQYNKIIDNWYWLLFYDDFRYLGTIIDKIDLFYEGQWAQVMAMALIFILL